jgi:serine/threonine protein phosphatase PrpC
MPAVPAGTPEAEQLGMADFMVLACDGLWDCMTNQQAVTFLHVSGWPAFCKTVLNSNTAPLFWLYNL